MFIECRHVKPSGIKCKSPALRSTPYCYFHGRLDRSRNPAVSDEKLPIQLPSLEDFHGIQIALHQVLGALANSRIEPRRASLLLRGLRIAADLSARSPFVPPSACVRDLSYQNDGSSLALEKSACEPPEDCLRCKKRDRCADFEDYEDEVEELEALEAEEEEKEEEEKEVKTEEHSASIAELKASIDTSKPSVRAVRAPIRAERDTISNVILSERSESKDLQLLLALISTNSACPDPG